MYLSQQAVVLSVQVDVGQVVAIVTLLYVEWALVLVIGMPKRGRLG